GPGRAGDGDVRAEAPVGRAAHRRRGGHRRAGGDPLRRPHQPRRRADAVLPIASRLLSSGTRGPTSTSACGSTGQPRSSKRGRARACSGRNHNERRPTRARGGGPRPPGRASRGRPPPPPVPAEVNPDAWLRLVDGRRYLRTVSVAGAIVVEHERYY